MEKLGFRCKNFQPKDRLLALVLFNKTDKEKYEIIKDLDCTMCMLHNPQRNCRHYKPMKVK